jgi:hypothetical protein
MQSVGRNLFAVVAVALAGLVFAQPKTPPLYTLSSNGWQRSASPTGEVFTCSVCEAQIQVQVDVGPPLGPNAPYRTNKQFISRHRKPEQQRLFAEGVLKSQIPVPSGYSLKIERTGITKFGGIEALQFMGIVDLKPVPTRNTTLVLIHRGRMVKVILNYQEDSFGDKAYSAVDALFSSIKFL